jgi:hypothetical protein
VLSPKGQGFDKLPNLQPIGVAPYVPNPSEYRSNELSNQTLLGMAICQAQ